MAVALEQFVKQLEDSGVISPGKLESFIPPKASPKDAQELARQLIQTKQLTKYQVQEIYLGRSKSLILGNYTILDKIGAGGMGQVFKAEHRRMHRVVAIKLLPESAVTSASGIGRFQREAVAAARLTHPNIVAAFDADEANGIHFLAMEYIEGSDLAALVTKNGPLPVRKATNYILQAARGLEFAHGEQVVHRDIKPANLLLDKKGTVKILDMGLAHVETGLGVAAQAELTGSGAILGTVDFMAPEQGTSARMAGARADIYSLGCTLYYLLIGKPIYAGDSVTAKLLAHQHQPIPDLCRLNDDVPEQLQSIFRKMVAKKIEDRYVSMSEVVSALEDLEASMSGLQAAASVLDSDDMEADGSALSFLGELPKSSLGKSRLSKSKVNLLVAQPLSDPGAEATPEVARGRNKKVLVGIAAAAGLALVALAGVLLSSGTKVGTLTVRTDRLNVAVQVLDAEGKVESNQSGVDGKVSISINSGKHRLRVEKFGYQVFSEDFSIEPGGAVSIQANLEPVAPEDTWGSSAFRSWRKDVVSLPVEKQAAAVAKKLQELNPDFDGTELHKIENGVVTELHVVSDHVTDISPVRALAGLQILDCAGTNDGKLWNGQLSDLSPLSGMPLRYLNCGSTQIRDLSPLAGMKLTTLLTPLTHVSDLSPLAGMPLTKLSCAVTSVANLLPLRGMPLTDLDCNASDVSDLSALKGSALVRLDCGETSVVDLSPLLGIHLTSLGCEKTQVADLSPLRGMRLSVLKCSDTKVASLSPLEGMPLTELSCDGTQVTDLSSLHDMNLTELVLTPKNITKGITTVRQMKSLVKMGIAHDKERLAPDEFWRKYDTGDLNPSDVNNAAFKKWMKDVPSLPAEEQVNAVVKRLKELNPQYGGRQTHNIENGVVTELHLSTDPITDLTPLRVLAGLRVLECSGAALSDLSPLKGIPLTQLACRSPLLADLSPLRGMPLIRLDCGTTIVSDLSPLKGMRLQYLDCSVTRISDLAALSGMPLTEFHCNDAAQVADLLPLKGMPLTELNCDRTQVSDLSPLKAMPLTELHCAFTGVSDLSPLEGMRLTSLDCTKTEVADLSPLKGMPLTVLISDNTRIHDLSPVKGMPLLNLRCGGTMVSDLSPLKGSALKKLGCFSNQVSDLSPLQGLPLETLSLDDSGKVSDLSPLKGNASLVLLHCNNTQVSDLSPLDGMNLTSLWLSPKNITKGIDVVRQMKSLQSLSLGNQREALAPVDFWTKFDAGEFNPCDRNAAFEKWRKDVAAMSAENQMAAVVANLLIVNPHFDGKENHKIENGVISELRLSADQLTDISPVRALVGLKTLYCGGGSPQSGLLFDLSPLRGMPLTGLKCNWSQVSDLSPLAGMRLTYLDCGGTRVHDLSPLRGMPVTGLWCSGAPISDLAPLGGMPLTKLYCDKTQVSDMSPLKGMELSVVTFSPKNIAKGIEIIRGMKSVDRIGIGWQPQDIFSTEEFWKKYDTGEFKQ